ncbi:CBN-CPB-2 protein [Caenorhabditis brenneri]|uniref:CBN-CPB-2 protein n=1 Tax=Caenorhabditis brenneri TaxID=135651 RepID=G0MZH3_CAEBE|nr:CBN-CPB-2 protein [Caenorhabditis brenneri]
MSKSRRVFLSIQGNDDFWGNGDRLEEKKLSSIKHGKLRSMNDGEDEIEDKYFFNQSKLGRQHLQHLHEKEEEKMFEERDLSLNTSLEEPMVIKNEETVEESEEGAEEETSDTQSVSNRNLVIHSDSTDTFYNNYRNYFRSRPEVLFLIRSMDKNAPDNYDRAFIDLYEKTRKQLETYPDAEMNQILRCGCPSGPTSMNPDPRSRNKHAVVVSNFREPDRRLGRYSKYYYHHNVGPEVYSRKVFVGGLPACLKETDILNFFTRYGRLQVDWPSKNYGCKSESDPSVCNEIMSSSSPFPPASHLGMSSPPFGQINPFMAEFQPQHDPQMSYMNRMGNTNGGGVMNHGLIQTPIRNVGCSGGSSSGEGSIPEKKQQHLGYVFLLFEKERSVRELVSECFEEEEGLFITLESAIEPIRVQIRPWLLADAEFLMDFNVPINTKLVAFIGGVPRPLKAVELAHFFEQTYGNVVCVGIDIDNKFKYPRGSGRVAFSNYDAYVQAITDRYIVLDHEDIHKRVEIKPYFFHNQSCEECSGRYNRQYAPYFCPSLECFQYYCEPCWHKMHAHPSRFHHMPVVKGV